MDTKFSNVLILGLVGAAWAWLETDSRRAKGSILRIKPRDAHRSSRSHLRVVASNGQVLGRPTLVWSR